MNDTDKRKNSKNSHREPYKETNLEYAKQVANDWSSEMFWKFLQGGSRV